MLPWHGREEGSIPSGSTHYLSFEAGLYIIEFVITLILLVIFGLVFGYFATQNATYVVIHFLGYSTRPLPLYLIILISIGVGILIMIIFTLLKWFNVRRKLSRKEKDLKKTENEVSELTKTVHKLELKNAKLEAEVDGEDVDENSI